MTKNNDPDFEAIKGMDFNEFKVWVYQEFRMLRKDINDIKYEIKGVREDIRKIIIKALGIASTVIIVLLSIIQKLL